MGVLAASTSCPWMLPTRPDFMLSGLVLWEVGIVDPGTEPAAAAAMSSRGALGLGERGKKRKCNAANQQ